MENNTSWNKTKVMENNEFLFVKVIKGSKRMCGFIFLISEDRPAQSENKIKFIAKEPKNI